MALFLRVTNHSLLKYVAPNKSLMLITRPVTMNITDAPRRIKEGYDEKNMRVGRPMSPHLTIYAPQLTSMLSITHRGMGMALGGYMTMIGLGVLVLPHTMDYYLNYLEDIGWFTHFFLKECFTFPMCYHYINGIRHLCWDMGQLLKYKQVYKSGYVMVAATCVSALLLCL
ncbi:SdhC [Trypoxylus dichotomus]